MSEEPRLTSPKEVRALLETLGHRPNKGLGQNYLIDANILDIIANTADIQPDENVLEIGPGLGALTERIIPKAKSVTCIEKDPTMVKYLKSRFSDFTLIESDALDVDLDALFAGGIAKVAANLPYSVASRLMVDISECGHRPELMSLTIQKEVADRLCAPAGDKHYGLLSVLTGVFYVNKLVKKISPTCFLPPPKVWSAVVRMERRDVPIVGNDEYPMFKQLVKSCFTQRRKQIGTILKKRGISPVDDILFDAGIDHAERPERIEIERWAELARVLS
ncbi:16S rRNA (adenine(1518)-N(6)/adenine(1519)-N(6))-dimethyltransferase RsmA [Pontiella sulfatireligans]|uniref:Ribosomal RNA small subunit methyltransferase A n=1 Tax=Pontiella sulfatireligans TaxID=2750658 RepID=A0A6C2UJC5_9BACT|nr:16S rRNA (adenine(1518)-N(6)/adenine(1519)-N(6))-dimethyltransferase RsmA [Pontiella sulfatireligans]VGO20208.1 Ribosomal RNA small subunit methyltransferase A [Pontiella sulfatireligans]